MSDAPQPTGEPQPTPYQPPHSYPPPGQYPPPAQYPPGQYPPPGQHPQPVGPQPMSPSDERLWAMLSHRGEEYRYPVNIRLVH